MTIRIDKNQYDENKPLDMHNLQFDIAAERINLDLWIIKKMPISFTPKGL